MQIIECEAVAVQPHAADDGQRAGGREERCLDGISVLIEDGEGHRGPQRDPL